MNSEIIGTQSNSNLAFFFEYEAKRTLSSFFNVSSDEIEINGSVKTAQQLADLIALASIDVEELVSHYTGDIIAHQLGKSIKLVKGKANNDKVSIVETLKNDLTTYL